MQAEDGVEHAPHLALVARVQHVQIDRGGVVHDVGVVLAGEDVAGAAHVGRELIDLVEAAVDHCRQKSGSRRSPTTKSSAFVSAYSWRLRSTPRTQQPSCFRR